MNDKDKLVNAAVAPTADGSCCDRILQTLAGSLILQLIQQICIYIYTYIYIYYIYICIYIYIIYTYWAPCFF